MKILKIKKIFPIPLLVAIFSASLLFSAERVVPSLIYRIFAYPAGGIVGFFLNAPTLTNSSNHLLIPTANKIIHITQSCSGFGFFCIVYSFLVFSTYKSTRLKSILTLSLLILPIAYILSIITNSFRIIAGYYADLIIVPQLAANFKASLHQGIGVFLFLTVLFLISLILKTRFGYERT
tara:strand:+ start:174 stop:710 length:537 start_codon:yes stop_codon:yes gene_type:complete